MSEIHQAIDQYLEAVEQVYGPDYRQRTQVSFGGGHYVTIKHPDTREGEVIPVGHLALMTENLMAKGK